MERSKLFTDNEKIDRGKDELDKFQMGVVADRKRTTSKKKKLRRRTSGVIKLLLWEERRGKRILGSKKQR